MRQCVASTIDRNFVHSLIGAARFKSSNLQHEKSARREARVPQDARALMGRALFSAYVQEHNSMINNFGEEAYYHQVQQQQQPAEEQLRAQNSSKNGSSSRSSEIVPQAAAAEDLARRPWNERRVAILKSRSMGNSQQTKDELAKSIREMKRWLNHAPDPKAFDYELKYQEMLLKLQGALSPLSRRHFSAATVSQLLVLLRGATASGSFRLGFVTSTALHELCHQRLPIMSGSDIIGTLNIVLTIDEDQGVPMIQRRAFAELLGEALLAPMHDDAWFRGIHPHSVAKLMYGLMPNLRRDKPAQQHGLPPAQQLLTDAFGYRVLQQVLRHALIPSDVGEGGSDNKPIAALHASLQLSHIVCFVCAIAHYRVPSDVSMQLLVVAAPLLRDGAFELQAYQLSRILMAYAHVGYKNMEWFTAVGQRAGDLGEHMSEDDAAQILNAFEIVGIEHATLRRSLESSMRLKSLRRSSLFNKVF